ncbi:MAG TPA: (2Fe-2S)-binding protein [Parasulfuritortus sp.]
MYICICRAVTEQEIRDAIELGANTLTALRNQLGVSTQCGKCDPEVRRILKDCKASHHDKNRRKA